MGLLGWIVLGLVAGAIAKAIMPRIALGWFGTMILGIVGAIVGGFLGQLIFKTDLGTFFDLRTWLLAIGGSLVVIAIYSAMTGRKNV